MKHRPPPPAVIILFSGIMSAWQFYKAINPSPRSPAGSGFLWGSFIGGVIGTIITLILLLRSLDSKEQSPKGPLSPEMEALRAKQKANRNFVAFAVLCGVLCLLVGIVLTNYDVPYISSLTSRLTGRVEKVEPTGIEPEPPVSRPLTELPPLTALAFGGKSNINVSLPDKIEDLRLAGGGRFLLLYFKKLAKVGIFDVSKGELAGYIPAWDKNFMFAGGANRVVTADDSGIVSVWNLLNLEQVGTQKVANQMKPSQLLLGHASAGPAFLGYFDPHTHRFFSFDLATFDSKPVVLDGVLSNALNERHQTRVSASNTTITNWGPNNPSGFCSILKVNDTLQRFYEHESVSNIASSADGRVLFCKEGLFTNQLKSIHREKNYLYSPAAHGDLYLRVLSPQYQPENPNKRTGMTLHAIGNEHPIASLAISPDFGKNYPNHGWSFTFEKQVILIPNANAIISISSTRDKMLIFPFNQKELLKSSSTDYLFVDSEPIRWATRGSEYRYQVNVCSKKGGTQFELASGPSGMQIDPTGLITWKVPSPLGLVETSVTVDIRDKSSQKTQHIFTIWIDRTSK